MLLPLLAIGCPSFLSGGCSEQALSTGPDGSAATTTTAGSGGSGVVPLDGRCGATPTLLVAATTFPIPPGPGTFDAVAGALVVNGSDLYYVVNVIETGFPSEPFVAGALMRVPVRGGQPTQIATGYVYEAPTFTKDAVIVAETNAVPNMDSASILAFSLAGGSPRTLVTLSSEDSIFDWPVTDGEFVYFVDSVGVQAVSVAPTSGSADVVTLTKDMASGIGVVGNQMILTFPQGEVESLGLPPDAGGAPIARATGLPAGQSDPIPCGDDACWLAGSQIEKMSPMSGAPSTVATLPASAGDLAFDGSSFYAVTGYPAPQHIVRISADGHSDVTLVTMANGGGGVLAVDDECVYWTGAKGIFSLAKTANGPFEQ